MQPLQRIPDPQSIKQMTENTKQKIPKTSSQETYAITFLIHRPTHCSQSTRDRCARVTFPHEVPHFCHFVLYLHFIFETAGLDVMQ